MSIQQHVETLRELARKVAPELTQINDAKALQELRVKYMGKKGALAEIAKVMRELSAEERPMLGQVMNEVREEIELILTTHQKEIEARMLEAKLRLETVDVTLPGILPRVVDADSFVCGGKGDFAGIHAAQCTGVDGNGLFLPAARFRTDAAVGSRTETAAGNVQILRPNAGIDFGCPGKNAGVVCFRSVQTPAVYADSPSVYPKTFQTAVVPHRRSGGKRYACRIYKAAAVHLYACGVGHYDFGAPPCGFDITVELRRGRAVDLVDDNARFAASKPRIALYPAAQSGLHIAAAVVQNGSALRNVELAVFVYRHARRARGLDVHLRQAVGGLQYGGLPGGGRIAVGADGGCLCGHSRCHARRHHGNCQSVDT